MTREPSNGAARRCAAVAALTGAVIGAPAFGQDNAAFSTPSAGSYHVTGVMVSNAGRVAIINGKLSREGDLIEGAEVLRIEACTGG